MTGTPPLFGRLLWVALIVGTGACSTTVERVDSDKQRDLSGDWNDTDSRLVSEAMINELMDGPWLQNYRRAHDSIPTVIVGTVNNLSHEHINTRTFINDMERALINSGKITFVASRAERDEVREERRDQDTHAREETRSRMGQETGADFMLKGSISSIMDVEGRRQVRYYQIDLTLIDLESTHKVWLGQKKIKKFVSKASVRP